MAPTMGLCGMVRTHSQRRRVVDLGVDIKLSFVLVFFHLSLHNIQLWFLLISIAILLQFPLATYMHTWSKKIKYPVFKSIFFVWLLLVMSYCLSMFGSLRPVYLRPATIKLLWESSTITANFSLKSGNGIIKTNKKFNFAPSLSCCF